VQVVPCASPPWNARKICIHNTQTPGADVFFAPCPVANISSLSGDQSTSSYNKDLIYTISMYPQNSMGYYLLKGVAEDATTKCFKRYTKSGFPYIMHGRYTADSYSPSLHFQAEATNTWDGMDNFNYFGCLFEDLESFPNSEKWW